MIELRVVHGGLPTDEELAAVVAVLTSRASRRAESPGSVLHPALSRWVSSGLVKGTRTKV